MPLLLAVVEVDERVEELVPSVPERSVNVFMGWVPRVWVGFRPNP
uniref:Uncharacterized protein n=1 Tax=Arundo donax TaxID=35708 RepID=A0A0A8YN40_ARUDO